jgi:hypothetical protein
MWDLRKKKKYMQSPPPPVKPEGSEATWKTYVLI